MTKNASQRTVQRINFIQKEPFVLTYKLMATYAGIFALVCFFFVGAQWLRVQQAQKKITALENEVKAMRVERDQKFRDMAAVKGPRNAQESLVALFEKAPPWAAVLRELTAVTPRSLWLTNLKSVRKEPVEGAGGTSQIKIQLSGQAEEAPAIAQFLKILSGSSFFQDVVLTASQRQESDHGTSYSFSIDLLLAPSEGKGL